MSDAELDKMVDEIDADGSGEIGPCSLKGILRRLLTVHHAKGSTSL